ncbi:MAG: sugar phosphate nucleotidyltransferase [Candidatus Omnitrophica bacterium]|jgi:mannose-1-phosphate guanylyltransferase|nr:sugar phosphate nucleotidyltransferase [Candidatus Omnitrophota bacterium]
MQDKPIILILCGGRSLRLWPLCECKSKNFLDIFGFSPLELTIKRFLKITTSNNIFLIANEKEKDALLKLKSIKKENIFFEPESKNTAAAILFSLNHLKQRFPPDKVLIISPVDHLIKEKKEFYDALKKTINVAKEGWISTLGIQPDTPTPNFGYIQIEEEIEKDVFSIKKFVEKPTRPAAEELIRKGNSFYNSGIFISCLSTLDKEYKKYYPYYDDFMDIFKKDAYENALRSLYGKIEDSPFDKAIMEKTTSARLVKASFFWKDFGTWHAIYESLPKDKSGNVKRGRVFIHNGSNNLIYLNNLKKNVLVVGLEDVFFIDTEKYTLITNRRNLDNLKPALKELKTKFK